MKLGKAVDPALAAHSVEIDVDKLISSRLLIQANSGAGKSWAIRRICEQTHGQVQHLIIDPESEYHTLREKYDYVLAGGSSGDCPADPRSASILARKLMELRASAILDIYDLKVHERVKFVRLFLESLLNLPRTLWHPVLVIIDECHMFSPQSGQAESASAVINLMAQGRKRQMCGVLATQRISRISKDAIAETNNKLVGRTALDVDMARAAEELGFIGREERLRLRKLDNGHFFAFGPAISREVIEVLVGPVETTHISGSTKRSKALEPPPPPAKVKAMLAKLADLPQQAAEEAKTLEQLRDQNRKLERELATAKKGIPSAPAAKAPDPAILEAKIDKARRQGRELATRELLAGVSSWRHEVISATGKLTKLGDFLQSMLDFGKAVAEPAQPAEKPAQESWRVYRTPPERPPRRQAPVDSNADVKMGAGERAVLATTAMHPQGVTRKQLTILTGYKRSTRDAYIQRLSQRNLVELNGDRVLATNAGIAALGSGFEPLPTGRALRDYWLDKLPKGEREIFRLLADVYPDSVHRADLDYPTGFKRSTRDAYIQRLMARQLVIEAGSGQVKASSELFE